MLKAWSQAPFWARASSAVLAASAWLTVVDALVARFARKVSLAAHAAGALFFEHALVLLPLGLGLAALAFAGEFAAKRWGGGPLRRLACLAAVFALAAVAPALLLAKDLTSGDWISRRSYADALRIALALAVVLSVALLAAHVAWTRGQRFWSLSWLAGCALLSYLNGRILVGYYPAFHLGLYTLVAALSLTTFFFLLERARFGLRPRLATFVLSLCVVAAAWGGRALSPKARELALRVSPGLAPILPWLVPRADEGVLLQTILRPAVHVPQPRSADPAQLGRKPKNVVLIVVDTLRADALIPLRDAASLSAKDGDTPFLDDWLQSAYRFTNAYSQASRTNRSIAASLYSRENFEDPAALGMAPPAIRARQLGLEPVAVVPDWYMLPNSAHAAALLEGFAAVETYLRYGSQERFVPLIKKTLNEVASEPFFLWLHYYGMHAPTFIGKGKKHPKGSTPSDRYRAALRYMDGQFEKVVAALRKHGALDDTLIVLMSDHGELLGERGLTEHGQGVSEEEVHVPLAIWVPGAGSGNVDALAGNIDVIPTIFALLGDQSHAPVRGRSLVPEMATLARESDRSLYTISGDENRLALIDQRHRLHFERRTGVFSLYGRTDAEYAHNLLGNEPPLDWQLIAKFVQRNPALFQQQMEDDATRAALLASLKRPANEIPLGELEYLLDLAALSKDAEVLAAAGGVYDQVQDRERRIAVVLRLHPSDVQLWSARATALLKELRGHGEEPSLVSEITHAQVVGIDAVYVSQRLTDLAADCASPLAGAWLALAGKQGNLGEGGLVALGAQLECALRQDPEGDAGVLARALASIGDIDPMPQVELEAKIVPLLDLPDDWLAVTAVRALSSVGTGVTRAVLEERLDPTSDHSQSDRMVEAEILALARLQGAAITPQLVRWGSVDKRRFAVMRALVEVGDERCLPFLREQAQGKTRMHSFAASALASVTARLEAE